MEKTQRIVVVLLVLAILFSVVSIMISFGAFSVGNNVSGSQVSTTGNVVGGNSGGISFFVEGSGGGS